MDLHENPREGSEIGSPQPNLNSVSDADEPLEKDEWNDVPDFAWNPDKTDSCNAWSCKNKVEDFPNFGEYQRHMVAFHRFWGIPQSCEYCHEVVWRSEGLKNHVEHWHNTTICTENFPSVQSSHQTLLPAMNDEKAWPKLDNYSTTTSLSPWSSTRCEDCLYDFASDRELEVHWSNHHYSKPHLCEYCAVGFKERDKLKHHISTHHNTFSYQCGECMEILPTSYDIGVHISSWHSSTLPHAAHLEHFNCEKVVCSFPALEDKLAWPCLPKESLGFYCQPCKRSLNSREEFDAHESLCHASPEFRCHFCGEDKFEYEDEFIRHHREWHDSSIYSVSFSYNNIDSQFPPLEDFDAWPSL